MGKRKQVPSPPYDPAYADVLADGGDYRTRGERSVHVERRAQHEHEQRNRAERLAERSVGESPRESVVSPAVTPRNSESSGSEYDESQGLSVDSLHIEEEIADEEALLSESPEGQGGQGAQPTARAQRART